MSYKITIAILSIPLAFNAGFAGAETLVESTAPFSDATTTAGLKLNRESYGAAWGNFDNNLYPDLVVNNHRQKPGLYTNAGTGKFTDVALISGVVAEWQSHALADTHGATWADVNNDGWQDVFMSIGRSGNNTQQLLINETGNAGQRVLRMRDDEWGLNPATNSNIEPYGGRTPIWLDYDFDGSMDVMLASFGGNVPMLQQQFNNANNHAEFVDKSSAMGFECTKIHYGFLLDAYTPAGAAANDYKPEVFCSGEGAFPAGVFETSKLVQRTRTVGGKPQTYMGFNPIGFKAEVFPTLTSTTRTVVSSVNSVADSAVGDFNNDGLQDLILVRGAARPSGSNFSKDADGKYSLELLVQNGEKGVQFYVANDSFMLDIDWNKDSNEQGFKDPPLYIGGKNGVVKNIGYPQSTKTLLQKRNPVTFELPFHNFMSVSPALNLAEFEGEPYRNAALIPYFQLWFEYDNAGKRKWFFRHYGDQLGGGPLTYAAGYARVQSSSPMTAGATQAGGIPVFSTGMGGTEKAMAPMLLLQQRQTNPNGSSQAVFVQPKIAGSLKEAIQCASVTTGDFDNDGDVDFYTVCRGPAANTINYLYQNQFYNTDGLPTGQAIFNRVKAGNGSIAGAGGAEGPVGLAITDHAGVGDSAVTADYDLDGYLDLFVANGYNMRPKNAGGPYRLFHNEGKNTQVALFGKSNKWIEIDLVGAGTAASKTTKDAYGARVYIVEGGNRVMMREKNGGYHRWSQDHQRLHFGLGQRNTVNIEVVWPNGVADQFNAVATNHVYRIAQGPAGLTELK